MSNAPTADRRQRGALAPPQIDDRAFKPFWRVCDRVERACIAGLITPQELRPALAFCALHERAHASPARGGLPAANKLRPLSRSRL